MHTPYVGFDALRREVKDQIAQRLDAEHSWDRAVNQQAAGRVAHQDLIGKAYEGAVDAVGDQHADRPALASMFEGHARHPRVATQGECEHHVTWFDRRQCEPKAELARTEQTCVTVNPAQQEQGVGCERVPASFAKHMDDRVGPGQQVGAACEPGRVELLD